MTMLPRRLLAALTLAAVAASPAVAAKKPKKVKHQRAFADAIAGGGFHLEFEAKRKVNAAPSTAIGSFKGTLELGGQDVGFFKGPVTCLEVKGNDIGLFYPIKESEPAGAEMLGGGVFITVLTDGRGNATAAGFMPVPTDTAESCAPGLAPMPAEGRAVAKGG